MNIKSMLLCSTLLLASCGGGSGGTTSEIEGTWTGDLIQGMIFCSDGTGIGAGGGSVLREVTLEISGSDEIGSLVQASDGDCMLEGARDAQGFIATPFSGCDQSLTSIRFTLLEDGTAALKYHSDINKTPPGPTGIRCTISPDATMTRR